ncbi:hypothetical protein ACIP5Y_47010 [Nocardia sp. NPDC088792]|uniref:hypothetical protein n=1 Tax=Nocardia sp. NPDC088792 TaxID=3364332 RepID=UPI00380D1F86
MAEESVAPAGAPNVVRKRAECPNGHGPTNQRFCDHCGEDLLHGTPRDLQGSEIPRPFEIPHPATSMPETWTAVAELVSLPIFGAGVRYLARNPKALGAYFPAVVVGFVQQLTKLEEARTARYHAKAARQDAQQELELRSEEREVLRELPQVRALIAEAIAETVKSCADLEARLTNGPGADEFNPILDDLYAMQNRLDIQRRVQMDLEKDV